MVIRLEYFNGEEWIFAGGLFETEKVAWISLGSDCMNYRTVDALTNKVLTDNKEREYGSKEE